MAYEHCAEIPVPEDMWDGCWELLSILATCSSSEGASCWPGLAASSALEGGMGALEQTAI